MVNNAAIVLHLARQTHSDPLTKGLEKKPEMHAWYMPHDLPYLKDIQREAEQCAVRALEKEQERLAHPPSPGPLEKDLQDALGESLDIDVEELKTPPPSPERPSIKSFKAIASALSSMSSRKPQKPVVLKRAPEQWEIFSAIEKKDLMYLSEVRNRHFLLLLKFHGDTTPIVHALRIGKSHAEVALFLLGMFSKYVNQIPDENFGKPEVKHELKLLRVNLGLAIDFGLQTQQPDLIPSFMQTLVMSEGEQWVKQTSVTISSLLRDKESKPVAAADIAVRQFFTPRLKQADMILGLEEYIANAVTDLVVMAAWVLVTEKINADPIPVWYFARDDRVYQTFKERLFQHRDAIKSKLGRRLRWQLRALRAVLQGQTLSFYGKLRRIADEFDHEADRDVNYDGYDSS